MLSLLCKRWNLASSTSIAALRAGKSPLASLNTLTTEEAGVYSFSTREKTNQRFTKFVADQKTLEPIAATFAKAHFDTIMTDHVTFGFNRNTDPIVLQEYFNVGSQQALAKIYEQFLIRTEQEANK